MNEESWTNSSTIIRHSKFLIRSHARECHLHILERLRLHQHVTKLACIIYSFHIPGEVFPHFEKSMRPSLGKCETRVIAHGLLFLVPRQLAEGTSRKVFLGLGEYPRPSVRASSDTHAIRAGLGKHLLRGLGRIDAPVRDKDAAKSFTHLAYHSYVRRAVKRLFVRASVNHEGGDRQVPNPLNQIKGGHFPF